MTQPSSDLASRIIAAHSLFAPIRQRFDRPGVERGGCLRQGVTPIYVRKFGEHVSTIFPDLTSVEASFNAEQFHAITTTLQVLKRAIIGGSGQRTLSDRINDAYVSHTQPYFVLALLRATEAALSDFLLANPDHAPAVDALFCVAGSEGFRDLIRLYGARTLQHASAATTANFPDILAFVNLHERVERGADSQWKEVRYEVWCPGYDLAKEYHEQCVQAAKRLVDEQHIAFVPSLEEEVHELPENLVTHFSAFIRSQVDAIFDTYIPH